MDDTIIEMDDLPPLPPLDPKVEEKNDELNTSGEYKKLPPSDDKEEQEDKLNYKKLTFCLDPLSQLSTGNFKKMIEDGEEMDKKLKEDIKIKHSIKRKKKEEKLEKKLFS